ncbi:ABC transporter ATP-binding protein [Brachybacterium phenoliresistens]|uniref:ABC transporter ATP-binding protein n=1 Tax=Brachybacterium phenoliresistens TaxID=396014 RepID=UPI0031DCB9AD
MTNTIECDEVAVAFGEVEALAPTTLLCRAAESVAIMGPSGSGKTTLLRVIEGLEAPSRGSAVVLGQDQSTASRSRRADLRRRHMGLISQDADLLPEFTTAENVAFALLFDGVPRPRALAAATGMLERVGLADRARADVRTLSGGEAQRAAVARALVRPELRLIVADEPTASLDVDNAQAITELLLAAAQDLGASVLLATHDPSVAAHCDRVQRLARRRADGLVLQGAEG